MSRTTHEITGVFFITVEGIDGTGKSTAIEGLPSEDGEPQPGLLRLLSEAFPEREVVASREPGSVHRDGSTGELHLEQHLMKAAWILPLAAAKVNRDEVARVLKAATYLCAVEQDELSSEMYQALLRGERLNVDLPTETDSLVELLAFDQALSRRIEQLNARDLIRAALLQTPERLPTEAVGLMFLAGHLLHMQWLRELPEGAIVLSDRSAESQYAYSAPRGDTRILNLYEAYRDSYPDVVLLLTCDPEEAMRRVAGRDKLEQKDWTGVEFMTEVQTAYQDILGDYPEVIQYDTTGQAATDTIDRCAKELIAAL